LSDFTGWRRFTMEQMMTDPNELLKAYAENGSEEAFRELVARYFGLVYSTALRLLAGDTHRAEDVAQTVFADLARNATRISPRVMLGGWLHQRAFNVATTLLRGERRRQAREQEAAEMNALDDHSGANLARIAPLLDEAITQLKPEDQAAIIVRFFEHRDLRSLGEALGTNEDAAQKRVSRALEKLRVLLVHKGVTLSAAALGSALATDALTAAPVALAGSVAGAAMASAAAGGVSTITLLKALIMSKLNSTVLGAVLVIGMGAVIVQQYNANGKLRADLEQLQVQLQQMEQPAQPTTDAAVAVNAKPPQDNQNELLRLRGKIGVMNQELAGLRSSRSALLKISKMLKKPLDLDQFPDSYNLVKASSATNAGNATPAALLQTWL
jgi:RNA polymerase sigma factor (sigma-70 family)